MSLVGYFQKTQLVFRILDYSPYGRVEPLSSAKFDSMGGRVMKGRREKLVAVTTAALFGVVFGILILACGQREDQPEVRTDAPAAAKAKPDTPPAPAAPKAAEVRKTRGFDDFHSHVQDLGNQLEGLRAEASGDLAVVLGELEAEQAQLMAELDAIGGENEKWDAARAELVPKIMDLRKQIREFKEKVNG
jgi:hypothetical protein